MKPDDEAYWNAQRERVATDPATINFNTGTCGPTPIAVIQAVQSLRSRLYSSPSDFCWRQLPVRLNYARHRMAKFLRVDATNLLLLNNATVGLNLAVRSLDMPAGAEILTTDHEYGAMRLLLKHIAGERGWTIREIVLPYESESPKDYVAAFANAIDKSTRMIFFSHVMAPTGVVIPASEICRLATEAGAYSVVDGAHAPGLVELNLHAIDADFYAGNCHKWLLAPLGAAFLHVRKELREKCQPLVTSWGRGYDADDRDTDSGWGGSFWARDLEFHGTQDRCPQLVLPEVLDFRASLNDSAARRRQRYLAGLLRSQMTAAGFSAATPFDERLCGAMTAFHVPTINPVKARNYIWETHRIETPFNVAAGKVFWRVSTCFYNTPAEIERFVAVAQTMPWNDLQ